jgi:hypothetical protein
MAYLSNCNNGTECYVIFGGLSKGTPLADTQARIFQKR